MGNPLTTSPIASAPKQFYINRTFAARHYDIKTSDGECAFYVTIPLCGPVLRLGLGKESPSIAESYKRFLSRSITIGVEDPENPKAKRWEEMRRDSSVSYRWAMTLGEEGGEKLSFLWVQMLPPNYRLLDMQNGDILATFTRGITSRSCGILQVNKSYGRTFDLMVLTTFITMFSRWKIHIL